MGLVVIDYHNLMRFLIDSQNAPGWNSVGDK